MRIIDVWLNSKTGNRGDPAWLESYDRILMAFPARLQC